MVVEIIQHWRNNVVFNCIFHHMCCLYVLNKVFFQFSNFFVLKNNKGCPFVLVSSKYMLFVPML